MPVFAIVFRGTDAPEDFKSNFHWFTRFFPGSKNQYDFVRIQAKNIVKKIREYAGTHNVEVVVAGHSLGGGLAQQAAYAADGLETVFAFAPSAVTGYYDVENKNERKRRRERLRIYRIHERGEVLAYFRRFMKAVYPVVQVNPKIVEIRFNFQDSSGSSVKLHRIGPLAKNMILAWDANKEVTE